MKLFIPQKLLGIYPADNKICSTALTAILLTAKRAARLAAMLLIGLIQIAFANSAAASNPILQVNEPTRVIFDTDMWIDIDDMMALAMIHALQDRGELQLLAVTLTTEDPWIGPYVALINNFYGRADIAVGTVRGGVTPATTVTTIQAIYPFLRFQQVNYTQALAQARDQQGHLLYPRALTDTSPLPEAVSLLRKTLAAQPDHSVVIIQAGYSTNLARLLDSKADAISRLDGSTLVKNKVRLLSTMAGDFSASAQGNTAAKKSAPEFNMLLDVPSAQALFSRWPTPIAVSGREVGQSMLLPAQSIAHDFSYVEHHPVAHTYRYYELATSRWPHDHPTYDATSVLYAARPDRDYFSLSEPGTIAIDKTGSSSFRAHEGGLHRYLSVNESQQTRSLEAMIMLLSQPPSQQNNLQLSSAY